MQFSRYFKLTLKKFWIIVLLEIVALSATYYYTYNQQIIYSTSSTIILNPSVPSDLVPYLNQNNAYINNIADNYSVIIKSDKFAKKVQDGLGFPIGLEELKSAYSSKLGSGTLFFYVTGTSTDPSRAQKIANTVTTLFLAEGINPGRADSAETSKLFNDTAKQVRDEIKNLQIQIASLTEQINALKQQPADLKTADQLTILQTDRKDAIDTQSRLLASLVEIDRRDPSSNRDSALLIDEAKLPHQPENNQLVRNMIFAGVMALVVGVGVIVLLDFLDYTVRTPEDLTSLTGITSLGSVPLIRPLRNPEVTAYAADSNSPGPITNRPDLSRLAPLLVTVKDFKSVASESYRTLRTNILFSSLVEKTSLLREIETPEGTPESSEESFAKSFVITSTLPQEGKSLTSANLAIAFAQAGSKVILVDADMRQPTLHTLFGLSNDNGFSNLILAGTGQISSALKNTNIPNLVLVTAGNLPPNPSELLTSRRATRVINALRETAHVVIFDSPPSSLVTDAAVLANRVDCVLLVVRAGTTRRDTLLKTINGLKKVGAVINGTILNGVQHEQGGYYYYGYGNESPKKNRAAAKAKQAEREREKETSKVE